MDVADHQDAQAIPRASLDSIEGRILARRHQQDRTVLSAAPSATELQPLFLIQVFEGRQELLSLNQARGALPIADFRGGMKILHGMQPA